MNAGPTIRVEAFPSVAAFEIEAARYIAATLAAALHERGRCLVALSGGKTPRGVYGRLRELLAVQPVDLHWVHLIFTDERMVPPGDPASNYGMAERELIARIPIPPSNVHRIMGEAEPEAAAREYGLALESLLPLFSGICDLALLGAGEDGHTASLFPGTNVLRERKHAVRAVFVPQLKSWRVTLTLPVINRSRAVLFLVTGERKAAIVRTILTSPKSVEELPATLVRPDAGTVTWMLDAAAASMVPAACLSESGTRASCSYLTAN